MVYSVDVAVKNEAAILARFRKDRHVQQTPDTRYRFVTQAAPDRAGPRPVVIGAGPCGLFAGLILAQMGLPADHRRSRQGGARAHQGHLGAVADGRAPPRIQRAVRRGRRGHLLRRQALQPDPGSPPSGPQSAHRIRQGGRARGDPYRGASAYRHVPAGDDGRKLARDDRGARRRISLRAARRGARYRDRRGRARCMRGLHMHTGDYLAADHVVLAVGHSARDTFDMLHDRGVHIEAKPFSIGVRIEHPQAGSTMRASANARASRSRCRRLQPVASLRERAGGLQLLHVPGRHAWSPPHRRRGASPPTA